MFGTHDLALFIVSGLLLNFTPGPDMAYVMTRAVGQGKRSGVAAALGIGAGCCVHILAGAMGLSALLTTSATAFTIVKIMGALYLAYVGINLLLTRSRHSALSSLAITTNSQVFKEGFWTNALNPKVALFFLAFVPQFIDPHTAHKALAFVFLGMIFNFTGTLWNIIVALTTAKAGERLRNSDAIAWMSRGIGALFIALGVRLAFSGSARE